MSNYYRPNNDATAGDPWNTAFLSDRDVSGQVPINYVPHPGVYLTPACFNNGTYEDVSFEECFSNLLASEFRRFIVDVYWDSLNRMFRLCPVELPTAGPNSSVVPLSIPRTTSSMANLTNSQLSARQATSSNTTIMATSVQSNTIQSTITTTSIPPLATFTSPSGNTLYQVGPYQCTDSLGFDTLVSVVTQYISQTSFKIQARLQFIVINLHAASTISDPTSPSEGLSQSQLPRPDELLSNYLSQLHTIIYTPVELYDDRQNLNKSWFQTSDPWYQPLANYFSTVKLANGDLSSPDGWPSENYAQLDRGNRLLFGYGSVDSQIDGYDLAGDNTTIFMPGIIQNQHMTTLGVTGNVTSGCFYNSSTTSLDQLNSSWAVASVMNVDQSILGNAADNLTMCGISPVLNYTLDNKPASVDYAPYQNFGNQALFSWAVGQPENVTAANQNGINGRWDCAVMVSNDSYRGHWRVGNCGMQYRVACREANLPYVWTISSNAVPFLSASDACTGNTSFGVPRTGLEDLYLYHRVQSLAETLGDPSLLDGIWINFNSLQTDSCWVTTGPNGTCPYIQNSDVVRQKTILVPTIAAFIVLLLTVLTTLVKCNTNRRKSKVRKRGEGGWDYEGVPS